MLARSSGMAWHGAEIPPIPCNIHSGCHSQRISTAQSAITHGISFFDLLSTFTFSTASTINSLFIGARVHGNISCTTTRATFASTQT
jgi:hypothetical protein